MLIGIPTETLPGERRVALVPAALAALQKRGATILVERGAGDAAGHPDEEYVQRGATLCSRDEVFARSSVVCQVRCLGANPEHGRADLPHLSAGQILIGLCEPLTDAAPAAALAERGVTVLALELMPRITRAQSMDVLSSQATVAGYKAVILAAECLPKLFPMLMTAAGTIAAARVFVVGAGVAGLQAIATARRLGAIVLGYDIRPAVREQVESLGASFLEIELEATASEDRGGYAKAMDDAFYTRQREAMTAAVAESDVVITTAAVPGRASPVLVTAPMVDRMRPGGVVVDLAAERGGNCELTRADETVRHGGVTILGPTNLPATVPMDASQMFARNTVTFLEHLIGDATDGEVTLNLDPSDEIVEATMLVHGGSIVQPRVREILGLESGASGDAAPTPDSASSGEGGES